MMLQLPQLINNTEETEFITHSNHHFMTILHYDQLSPIQYECKSYDNAVIRHFWPMNFFLTVVKNANWLRSSLIVRHMSFWPASYGCIDDQTIFFFSSFLSEDCCQVLVHYFWQMQHFETFLLQPIIRKVTGKQKPLFIFFNLCKVSIWWIWMSISTIEMNNWSGNLKMFHDEK